MEKKKPQVGKAIKGLIINSMLGFAFGNRLISKELYDYKVKAAEYTDRIEQTMTWLLRQHKLPNLQDNEYAYLVKKAIRLTNIRLNLIAEIHDVGGKFKEQHEEELKDKWKREILLGLHPDDKEFMFQISELKSSSDGKK